MIRSKYLERFWILLNEKYNLDALESRDNMETSVLYACCISRTAFQWEIIISICYWHFEVKPSKYSAQVNGQEALKLSQTSDFSVSPQIAYKLRCFKSELCTAVRKQTSTSTGTEVEKTKINFEKDCSWNFYFSDNRQVSTGFSRYKLYLHKPKSLPFQDVGFSCKVNFLCWCYVNFFR